VALASRVLQDLAPFGRGPQSPGSTPWTWTGRSSRFWRVREVSDNGGELGSFQERELAVAEVVGWRAERLGAQRSDGERVQGSSSTEITGVSVDAAHPVDRHLFDQSLVTIGSSGDAGFLILVPVCTMPCIVRARVQRVPEDTQPTHRERMQLILRPPRCRPTGCCATPSGEP
jgi:hypothetical protein